MSAHANDAKRPIAVVGMGQLGGTFGQGLLHLGRPVTPFRRADSLDRLATIDPEFVLVAVAEPDLDAVLGTLPAEVRDRVALLQNELSPETWRRHGVQDPTVAVVWFEKKRGRLATVLRDTPIAGPCAELLVSALAAMDLPARRIGPDELDAELVRKNLFILGSNIAGLIAGVTTSELANRYRELVVDVLVDLIAIEEARLGRPLDRYQLVATTLTDFVEDASRVSMGRSAPERLARSIERADRFGLATPKLREIAPLPWRASVRPSQPVSG